MSDRVSWKRYFMNIAKEVATRSTCERKNVGAVIVRDKTILSTGYNGSIKGLKHCDEVGHEMVDGHCVRTTHAEANAIVQAAKNGVSINKSEIYSKLLNDKKIEHVVLNAKNHENEAEIIANAGKMNSVIITTSISGRGVDIQLGGKKGGQPNEELLINKTPDEK